MTGRKTVFAQGAEVYYLKSFFFVKAKHALNIQKRFYNKETIAASNYEIQ